MPLPHTGQELTAAAILRNDTIDLSSDEDLADDALEQLIKSKEEAEIFNDLPLFDVTIIHNFIDEWFDTPNISFEDLQLPIGLSVAFHGAIASELRLGVSNHSSMNSWMIATSKRGKLLKISASSLLLISCSRASSARSSSLDRSMASLHRIAAAVSSWPVCGRGILTF